jgi:ribosomal protein S15
LAQARARKAANISRQEVLKQERAAALGNPVRGVTTSFVQSFDTAGAGLDSEEKTYLNHFISREDVDQQLKESMNLSRPAPEHDTANEQIFKMKEAHERRHQNATDAITRIINMRNGNADARIKVNVQRCIETFGRHNTDKFLPPKAKSISVKSPSAMGQIESPLSREEQLARDLQPLGDAIKRAGADTGSSEVQIAILTAKIKSLADFLETRGRKDKVGKRDLRLLVHRRAKLLKYLRRKERGGPRWQRCIETLGLTEGTWKGEITL